MPTPIYVTYLDTVTRHGAPLLVRSYENGRGAVVYVGGESVGSIDIGSWDGYAPLLWTHRYDPLPTLADAVEYVARECGAPDDAGYAETVDGVTLSPIPGATAQFDDDGYRVVDVVTCDECGRSWDDASTSGVTPAPSGRCPFEYDHDHESDYTDQARALGRAAGIAAGSWAADGNTTVEHARKVLAMIDDGDPAAEQFLPNAPNLSGEWADATVRSLYEEITGRDPDVEGDEGLDFETAHGATMDAIANAWEESASEAFGEECERVLRAVLPDEDSEGTAEDNGYPDGCPDCGGAGTAIGDQGYYECTRFRDCWSDPDHVAEIRDAIAYEEFSYAVAIAQTLAGEWHSGQTDPLYGFASTGDMVAWGGELASLSLSRLNYGKVEPLGASEREAREVLRDLALAMAAHGDAGPFLRVLAVRGTIEDDGDGGSEWVPSAVDADGAPEPHSDEWIPCGLDGAREHRADDVAEIAAETIRDAGATQNSGSWWSDPDGSQTCDYSTGEREETSVHPYGFTAEMIDATDARLREES